MAGIEEAFEKFSDRLAREESKRYSRDEQGDYVEEVQDPYPLKLGPLQLGANANITTGRYSPDEYQNISTMNRNLGLRGKLDIPNSGIALLGSIGDVRSSSQNKLNLPFNPMTGEAEPYSETMRNVYKESPYSIGAQYNPQGTDQLFSALYNKGGGYNLGYNQGPVNVSYTSNPGLGNNVMVRGQYNFADGGVASMFRERPGYQEGGQTLDQLKYDPNDENIFSKFVRAYEDAHPYLEKNGKHNPAQMKEIFDAYNKFINQATPEVPTVDPFSGQQVSAQDQAAFATTQSNIFSSEPERESRRYESREYNPVTGNFERVIREGSNYLGSGQSDPIVSVFDKEKGFVDINVPTIDPFSGQQVSAQDQSSFANVGGISPEDFLKENPGYVVTNLTDIAGVPRFNAYKPEVPTVDPFSGQQVSMQDQMAFAQPQADIFPQQNIPQPPSPVDQFIGERRFQAEADAAARSGIPFTKTIQDFIGNLYSGPQIAEMQERTFGTSGLPGATGLVSDLRHATAASQVRDRIADAASMGYFNPAGLIPQSLGLFGSQVLGAANEIQSIRPNMQSIRDIGEDLRANFLGAVQVPYGQTATATYNQLLNNPTIAAQRSQQEAAARVTPRMTMMYGGLTNTIPPAMGPDSQGVESLFRRRYN